MTPLATRNRRVSAIKIARLTRPYKARIFCVEFADGNIEKKIVAVNFGFP